MDKVIIDLVLKRYGYYFWCYRNFIENYKYFINKLLFKDVCEENFMLENMLVFNGRKGKKVYYI